jgi:hypothetical protein
VYNPGKLGAKIDSSPEENEHEALVNILYFGISDFDRLLAVAGTR